MWEILELTSKQLSLKDQQVSGHFEGLITIWLDRCQLQVIYDQVDSKRKCLHQSKTSRGWIQWRENILLKEISLQTSWITPLREQKRTWLNLTLVTLWKIILKYQLFKRQTLGLWGSEATMRMRIWMKEMIIFKSLELTLFLLQVLKYSKSLSWKSLFNMVLKRGISI